MGSKGNTNSSTNQIENLQISQEKFEIAMRNLTDALKFLIEFSANELNSEHYEENVSLKEWLKTDNFINLFKYFIDELQPEKRREILAQTQTIDLWNDYKALGNDLSFQICEYIKQITEEISIEKSKSVKISQNYIKNPPKVLSIFIGGEHPHEIEIDMNVTYEIWTYTFKSWWSPTSACQVCPRNIQSQKIKISPRVQMIFYGLNSETFNEPEPIDLGHIEENKVEVWNNRDTNSASSFSSLRPNTPGGLRNLGNTCYMNSVLQCLMHIPQFFSALSSEYENNELKIALFNIIKAQNDRQNLYDPLLYFKQQLRAFLPQFSSRYPNDVKYFFLQLMSVFPRASQIFQIELSQAWTCSNNHKNGINDTILLLSIDRYAENKNLTIKASLSNYFKTSIDELTCNTKRCDSREKKRINLEIAYPQILVIYLSDSNKKSHTQVGTYPPDLKLDRFVYQLKALIKTSEIHATARAEVDSRIYEFDDWSVRACRSLIHPNASLLFYSLVGSK